MDKSKQEQQQQQLPSVDKVANEVYKALRLVPATADQHDALRNMMEFLLSEAKKGAEAESLKKKCDDQEITIKSLQEQLEGKKKKVK